METGACLNKRNMCYLLFIDKYNMEIKDMEIRTVTQVSM